MPPSTKGKKPATKGSVKIVQKPVTVERKVSSASAKPSLKRQSPAEIGQDNDDDDDEESDSDEYSDADVEALLQGGSNGGQDEDSDERDGGGDSSSDESDDVTEEGMQRLMELLGEEDLAELGFLDGSDVDDDEDEDEDEEEEAASNSDEDEQVELDAGALDGESDSEDGEEEQEEIAYSDVEGDLSDDDDTRPVERTTVNDKAALERVLASFKVAQSGDPDAFFDTLTLTNPVDSNITDPANDLERELAFYKQALWAATHAEQLHNAAQIPFHRPSDYFAEMLKTDAHMSTIRQNLLDEQAGIAASEAARKLREQKKFGKKVQVEKVRERQKEKREIGERLEGLKKKRKNGDSFATTEDFDIALEDAIANRPAKRAKVPESERGGRGGRGMSRRGRDSKHGHPTTSRRPKENNDRLDGAGFGGGRGGRGRGGARGGSRGGRGGSRGSSRGGGRGSSRPGKSKRQ